uniref:Zinc finger protein n=1 Tax=Loa loa TaxID=7209 RepID=A0A1I7W503_LOALO
MHFIYIIFVLFQLSDTQTIEPQKEPLDLSMSGMYERRIGPSALSAPYVREEQIEFNEIDQNDASSLNAPIQEEICRRKSGVRGIKMNRPTGDNQNEQSNIQTIERKQSKGKKGNIKRKHPERSTHIGKSGSNAKHVWVHTGEKPFSCPEYMTNFTEKGSLLEHMMIHTGEKPYNCSKCGMNFTQKGNLHKHMRIHTGEKPYSCSNCGMNFTQKVSLLKHMMIHTGEKPYNCSRCGMNFTQKGNLDKHIRRIHSGEKPYSCSECGMNFADSWSRLRHWRTHINEK